MTTLFDMTLQVARQVTDAIVEGTATNGSATTLTDTNLTQANGHFARGTLWIKSGTHQNKVVSVTSFAANVLTFPTLTTSIGTPRYAVLPEDPFPYSQIVGAINSALDDSRAWVLKKDDTLTGDGETLEFTLPTGVYNEAKVKMHDLDEPTTRLTAAHWEEIDGKLRFDNGHAPIDGWVIHIWYKSRHAELTAYSDTIDNSLNLEWLRWRATEILLTWAMRRYQNRPDMRIEEFLNQAMKQAQTLRPHREPLVIVKTANARDW